MMMRDDILYMDCRLYSKKPNLNYFELTDTRLDKAMKELIWYVNMKTTKKVFREMVKPFEKVGLTILKK